MDRDMPKLRPQFWEEEREDIVGRALASLARPPPPRVTWLQAAGRVRDIQITVIFVPYFGIFSNWEVRARAEGQTESTESMRFLRYSTARRYFDHLVDKHALEVTSIINPLRWNGGGP